MLVVRSAAFDFGFCPFVLSILPYGGATGVTPQKYPIIFIIKIIIYFEYNWANLGIFFLGIFR